MSLYAFILLLTIALPLSLSFDKRLQFYRKFNVVLPSIVIVAIVYIVFDIYLTKTGVWGFNIRYISSLVFLGLPLEEWLFFLVTPYASLFIHYSFFEYYPKFFISTKAARIISILLILLAGIVLILNSDKIYTVYILSFFLFALLLTIIDNSRLIGRFYVSFLIILIPFFIVNGILTGSFIDEEVVWYNQDEILGIRIFTIPIEDFAYAFSLVLFNLLLIKRISKKLELPKNT